MTFHILAVEDDEDFIDEIHKIIEALPGRSELKIARSRDEAIGLIRKGEFLDLAILDLKIPTATGGLDKKPEHGYAVFNEIRSFAPGTPILVLTGSPVEDFVSEMLKHQQQIDIWSMGEKIGNISFCKKYNVNLLPETLSSMAKAIDDLSQVEVDRGGVNLNLAEDRLIRIFTKKVNGVRCVVSKLGGGLSGARVIRLCITDSQGVSVHNAVAKLAELRDVRKEGECYDNYMARLHPATTPRKLAVLEFGAHMLAGVFFGLADGYTRSVFECVKEDADDIIGIIRRVENSTTRWVLEVPETRQAIKKIRQNVIDDASIMHLAKKYKLDWVSDFESREVQCRWACAHGDLHGFNILVSDKDEIVLIDYGDVGEGPTSRDPITLELSLLFHSESPCKDKCWPTLEQATNWGDIERYLVDCPFPDFVRECRDWALRVAVGQRDISASAYSYLIRQLKYDDTKKPLVLALLTGVKKLYDDN